MIIRESTAYTNINGVVFCMSDAAILAASIKTALLEISRQAGALGAGLQNAAPGDRTGAANLSVSYLLDISENLAKIAEECGKIR
jgi:hypothetical protein